MNRRDRKQEWPLPAWAAACQIHPWPSSGVITMASYPCAMCGGSGKSRLGGGKCNRCGGSGKDPHAGK